MGLQWLCEQDEHCHLVLSQFFSLNLSEACSPFNLLPLSETSLCLAVSAKSQSLLSVLKWDLKIHTANIVVHSSLANLKYSLLCGCLYASLAMILFLSASTSDS